MFKKKPELIDIGARLRKAREENGLTIQQLAGRLGVIKTTVCHYESGRVELKITRVLKMIKVFGKERTWEIISGEKNNQK